MPDAYSRVWEDYADDLDAESLNDLESRMEARVTAAVGPLAGLVPETLHYPYFISSVLAGQLPVATDPDSTPRFGDGVGTGLWGYNPSRDRNPTNEHKWYAIDAVIRADANPSIGNRGYFRSLTIPNTDDPAEIVLTRCGGNMPTTSDPNRGYGPNYDGSDLKGVLEGATLGFLGWMGAIAVADGVDPSHQGWAARIGTTITDDCRQESLGVHTSGSVTLPQSTITVDASMDATTAADGTTMPFRENGLVGIGGQSVRYASRSTTKLFGCTGGTGTFASGTSVTQRRSSSGGRINLSSSTTGSADCVERIVILGSGGLRFGYAATNTQRSTWLNIAGGPGRYEELRDPGPVTATVVGSTGSTHYTYAVVGNAPYGGQTNYGTVTVTNGPATLNGTNYIKLEWNAVRGMDSFDVIRTASAGTPGTTGPIILGQDCYEAQDDTAGGGMRYGASACDTGLTIAGTNEVQTIKLSNTDGGHFTINFHETNTTNLAWNASAADITTALEGLPGTSVGDFDVVTSSYLGWTVTFQGSLAATDVHQMTVDTRQLTNSEYDSDTGTGVPPSVLIKTRTVGASATYSLPTRNSTADFTFDGPVGFNGEEPVAKPEITGDRSSATVAVLTDLLAALENIGLITDSTTA